METQHPFVALSVFVYTHQHVAYRIQLECLGAGSTDAGRSAPYLVARSLWTSVQHASDRMPRTGVLLLRRVSCLTTGVTR